MTNDVRILHGKPIDCATLRNKYSITVFSESGARQGRARELASLAPSLGDSDIHKSRKDAMSALVHVNSVGVTHSHQRGCGQFTTDL